jgi:phage-related minor tail protein
MAKNNTPSGESPEEVRAREAAEAKARAEEEAAAKAEAEAKAQADAETQAKAAEEAKAGEDADAAANAKTKPALLRHKTEYPKYRCAGLVLTQKPETYQVTQAQLEKLRGDPWVVIEKDAAPK